MPSLPRRRWLLPGAVYALILALSSVPGDALAGTPGWSAVVGHAGGYALLAATIHLAWDGEAAGLAAIVLAVALGVANELQQGLVPGRSPDVTDVAVDAVGALAGVLARVGTRRRRGRVSAPRTRGSRPPARGSAAPR